MMRSCSSFGMLPSAISRHRRMQMPAVEAADGANRQRERVADGLLVPALPSSRSIARQMSTLDIEARISLGDRALRVGSSSASHTSTSMTGSSALIELHRRLPMTTQPVVLRVTQALNDATA